MTRDGPHARAQLLPVTRHSVDSIASAATTARIVGVGTAVPPDSYTQEHVLRRYQIEDQRIRSLFLSGAIERRHLCLPADGRDGRPRVETQGELLHKHASVGVEIGLQALAACLEQAGAEPVDVRHLCCVSSTGFITPGFSARVIRAAGLSPSCSRLDVVGMGCNAGLNALAQVSAWSRCHPGSLAVMLCIEVCSAAYVVDGTMRTAVVNSLFGDGAAAVAVVGGGLAQAGPALLAFESLLIPEASEAMRYDWDDDQGRFSFFLDPEIPYVVGANAASVVDRLLHQAGLRRSEVAHWVLHSGGRKVIDAVRVNLGLTRHEVRHTSAVLREHGNLSSGAFLFAYARLVAEGAAARGDYGVLMTMGPGSTIEVALVRW
ncbi:3,5-dihydroxyphenylacetyl-CoA synthase DpgA [Dactylosporangium matsuzakiense]|uniref:Chalcone synthase n=1 Tax=Dactylosporangium matsuzakiense TaxID=53360 RepID=A0A9W6KLM5_9ACTN|nr:3,5-dihydroxyphenylacetyl-CoA synthase DpgA [Dactylosporangium matsuzakiense]GLL03743.1 putative chalcone synthase [Dactylosporangium matsuzakiense]